MIQTNPGKNQTRQKKIFTPDELEKYLTRKKIFAFKNLLYHKRLYEALKW